MRCVTTGDATASNPHPDDDAPGEPGTPGVIGEQPNRFQAGGSEPLDEAPDGMTPSDTTDSSEDSLPPG